MSRLRSTLTALSIALVALCATACGDRITDPGPALGDVLVLPDTTVSQAVTAASTNCVPTPSASSLKADATATGVRIKISLTKSACAKFLYRVKEETSVSWASVRGTQPVRGTQTLTVALSRNTGAERTARFLVTDEGGKKTLASFRITQGAAPCIGSISPTQITAIENAGSYSASLSVGSKCDWKATSDASFVSLAPNSGRGSAKITLKVASTATSRTARIIVTEKSTGRQIALVQLAQSAPPAALPCGIGLNPANHSVGISGGIVSSAVSLTNASCHPRVSSAAAWLTTPTTQVTGNTSVAITATANGGGARQGAIHFLHPSTGTLLGSITISQPGAVTTPCNAVTLASRTAQVSAAAQSVSVQITAPEGCPGTNSSSASWATPSPRSFSGSTSLVVAVAANTSTTSARTATITVRLTSGKSTTFAITQNPAVPPCTGAFRSTPSAFAAGGSAANVAIGTTGNCGTLTAAVSSSWITASIVSTGTLRIAVAANATSTSRSGTVRLLQVSTGAVLASINISQNGTPAPVPVCSFTVTPAALHASTAFTPFQFAVVPTARCNPWSAVSSDSWIQINSGNQYSGSAAILGSVSNHSGVNARGGAITLRGNDGVSVSIPITQVGNGVPQPTLQVSPAQLMLDNSFQQPVVRVTTTLCYSITSSASWIAVRGGTQLCGTQTVTLDVSFNSGAARSAVIFFGGTAVTVIQAGTH